MCGSSFWWQFVQHGVSLFSDQHGDHSNEKKNGQLLAFEF